MDQTPSRRRFLHAVLAGAAGGLSGCTEPVANVTATGGSDGRDGTPTATATDPAGTADTRTPSPPDSPTGTPPGRVGLETVATGFQALVDVSFAPVADRRYVVQQTGEVLVHGPEGTLDEPFLDLGDAVEVGGEKGLLGFALHPDFASNRRCYVRYSAPSRQGTPRNYSHTFVLAEFTATDDGRRARPDTERAVLEIPQPQGNHNAGDLAFGPDGLLYVAVGDGGAGGDQGTGHVDDWYDDVGGGNGQDVTENLLGSILRIDVDGREDGKPYAVPDDNPLVGEDGLDEHYAWGLRNPWRFSIDPVGTRVEGAPDIYAGDVGQRRLEEVDLVRPGGNYGWNVREATACFETEDCPDETDDGEPLLDPVVEYPHRGGDVSGISVIGGSLYRGAAVPSLQGRYVFGDWRAGGKLFVADPRPEGLWATSVLDVDGGGALSELRSFGRDRDGEVYVCSNGGDGWGVHRLASV